MKKLEWLVPGLVLIILVGFIIFSQKDPVLAGLGTAYRATAVAYTVTVGMNNTAGTPLIASSTQVLAANNDRFYARCQNRNTNGFEVSIMTGSTATTTLPSGIVLAPVSSTTPSFVVFDLNNPYTGAIYAYALATSSVMCVEN